MLIRMKEIRIARGMSQSQLAERAGITVSAVSRLENGGRGGYFRMALAVADALGVSVYDLTDRTPPDGANAPRPPVPVHEAA